MKTPRFLAVVAGLALFGIAAPVAALEIRLGEDGSANVRTGGDDREVRPRVSVENNRLNVDILSQPEPETEVNVSDDGLQIRRTRRPPERIIDFSVPLENRS